MTRQDWLECRDARLLLRELGNYKSRDGLPLLDDRRARLFAVAYSRHWWSSSDYRLAPSSMRGLFARAEAMADGHPSPIQTGGQDELLLHWCAGEVAVAVAWLHDHPEDLAVAADILRDIIGWLNLRPALCGLFGPRRGVCAECLSLLTDDVKSVALAAYRFREPGTALDQGRLGVLADALEDAGATTHKVKCRSCDGRGAYLGAGPDRGNPECEDCDGRGDVGNPVLEHLRSGLDHWRGCWAVDLACGRPVR